MEMERRAGVKRSRHAPRQALATASHKRCPNLFERTTGHTTFPGAARALQPRAARAAVPRRATPGARTDRHAALPRYELGADVVEPPGVRQRVGAELFHRALFLAEDQRAVEAE